MLLSCPPLADQPSGISEDQTPYHSERLAFPKMTAPAFLNRWITLESLATVDPNSAYDLHVVFSLSLVPILSFNSMGIRTLSHRKPDAIYSCYGFWLKGRKIFGLCFLCLSCNVQDLGGILGSWRVENLEFLQNSGVCRCERTVLPGCFI